MSTLSSILAAALATSALAVPSSAGERTLPREVIKHVVESRFVVDENGAYSFARSHEYSAERQGNLHAGPTTLDVSGVAQSNLLLDPAPVHVYDVATDAVKTTGHECAVHSGSLFRFVLPSDFFLAADLRHLFIRHTSNDRQNGGAAYPDTGGVAFRGTFSHEQKGDTGALLVGGGIAF